MSPLSWGEPVTSTACHVLNFCCWTRVSRPDCSPWQSTSSTVPSSFGISFSDDSEHGSYLHPTSNAEFLHFMLATSSGSWRSYLPARGKSPAWVDWERIISPFLHLSIFALSNFRPRQTLSSNSPSPSTLSRIALLSFRLTFSLNTPLPNVVIELLLPTSHQHSPTYTLFPSVYEQLTWVWSHDVPANMPQHQRKFSFRWYTDDEWAVWVRPIAL